MSIYKGLMIYQVLHKRNKNISAFLNLELDNIFRSSQFPGKATEQKISLVLLASNIALVGIIFFFVGSFLSHYHKYCHQQFLNSSSEFFDQTCCLHLPSSEVCDQKKSLAFQALGQKSDSAESRQ